jgi:hypothetical protein
MERPQERPGLNSKLLKRWPILNHDPIQRRAVERHARQEPVSDEFRKPTVLIEVHDTGVWDRGGEEAAQRTEDRRLDRESPSRILGARNSDYDILVQNQDIVELAGLESNSLPIQLGMSVRYHRQ